MRRLLIATALAALVAGVSQTLSLREDCQRIAGKRLGGKNIQLGETIAVQLLPSSLCCDYLSTSSGRPEVGVKRRDFC